MNEIFLTSDQGLGAYLLLLGYNCVGSVPQDETFTNHLGDKQNKMDFVFIDVINPGELAHEYLENKAVGKLKEFHRNTQRLRYFLRNPMSREDYEGLKNGND